MRFKKITKLFSITWVQLLLVGLATILVYANTMPNEFISDDGTFIQRWELTRSFKNIPEILKGALPTPHEGDWRPIKGLILMLDYKLFGTNPTGYHAQAILIHLASTFLVYLVARKIVEQASYNRSKLIAFLTALLFGIHPVHTEAITFVTSSSDIIGITFLLGSFYLYITQTGVKRKRRLIWSSLLAFFAFAAYEMALVLPLLVVLYDLCLKKRREWDWGKYVWYALPIVLYITIRYLILGVNEGNSHFEDNFFLTMLAMVKAVLQYIGLTIFPWNLSLNHEISGGIYAMYIADSSRAAFLAQRIWDPQILISLVILTTLITFALLIYRKLPLVTFSVFWFFIALLPVYNIVPLSTVLAERYLYLASFGWCLIVAWSTVHILSRGKQVNLSVKAGAVVVFAFLITFYSFQTIKRNFEWHDPFIFWESLLADSPRSVVANYNLGNAYIFAGDYQSAISHYKVAEENNQNKIVLINFNLGNAYFELGQFDQAFEQYKKSITLDPRFPNGYMAMGAYFENFGKTDQAASAYLKALSLDPTISEAYIKLGSIYVKERKYDKAVDIYKRASQVDPSNVFVWKNLAAAYKKVNKLDLAKEALEKASALSPDDEKVKSQLTVTERNINVHSIVKKERAKSD